MNHQDIVSRFEHIEYGEKNIEAIYRTNFSLFRYENSDKQNYKREELEFEKGVLKTPQPIASNHYDGFTIAEKDFREAELQLLDSIDQSKLNYGQLTKFRAYRQFVEYKAEFPNWYNATSRNMFHSLKESRMEQYQKSFNSHFFENFMRRNDEDGSPNNFYYAKRINSWRNFRDDALDKDERFKNRLDLLKFYNAIVASLMTEMIKFYNVVRQFDAKEIALMNSFWMELHEIKESLYSIKKHSLQISHNVNTGNYKLALEIQQYCIVMFEDAINTLRTFFTIRVEDSPLKKYFDDTLSGLKNAIDLQRLDYLLKVGAISKDDTTSDSQLNDVSNNIFKGNGEQIFVRFAKHYNNYTETGVIYSFLYYAMLHDEFIIESHSAFKAICKGLNNILKKWDTKSVEYKKHKTLKLEETYERVKSEIENTDDEV